jgi:hypothetical protein
MFLSNRGIQLYSHRLVLCFTVDRRLVLIVGFCAKLDPNFKSYRFIEVCLIDCLTVEAW